jgi:hypothetical protein
MAGDIQVQCFKCKTVYELDEGFRGKLVECAVCDIVFTVPRLGEKKQRPDLSQDSLLIDLKKVSEQDDTKIDVAVVSGKKPEGKAGALPGKDTKSGKMQKEDKAPEEEHNKPKWWQLSIGKKK